MIYSNIVLACKEKKISVSELERKLGFAKSSIYKWDKNRPSVDRVLAVAKELETTVEQLMKEG